MEGSTGLFDANCNGHCVSGATELAGNSLGRGLKVAVFSGGFALVRLRETQIKFLSVSSVVQTFSLYTNSGGPSESPLGEKVLSKYPERGTYLKPWDMSKPACPTVTDCYQGLSGVWGTSVSYYRQARMCQEVVLQRAHKKAKKRESNNRCPLRRKGGVRESSHWSWPGGPRSGGQIWGTSGSQAPACRLCLLKLLPQVE